ncbi:hypothetical protein NBRC116493_35730 [Aurantivibrio infirmus]
MNICHQLLINEINNSELATLWIVDENFPADLIPQVHSREMLCAVTNRAELHNTLAINSIVSNISDFNFGDLFKNNKKLAGAKFSRIVYRVSKERAVVNHCINESFDNLSEGGELILIGEKHDGIKTHAKNAELVFSQKSRIKKQGTGYIAKLSKVKLDSPSLLDCHDYTKLRSVAVDGFSFISKPGVFGWNKIDEGSKLLVETILNDEGIAQQKYQNALDLGCGWGYLTLASSELDIDKRFASDNNFAAVLAAEANFKARKMEVELSLDDCAKNLKGPFDLILCNPPFHRGFDVSEALTQKFINTTYRLVADDGIAIFVVNQFIPIAKLAEKDFSVQSLGKTKSFDVLRLSKRMKTA